MVDSPPDPDALPDSVYPIAEALNLPLGAQAHTDVVALDKRIPPDLKGMFHVKIEDDQVTGFHVFPDEAIKVMNKLLGYIDGLELFLVHGDAYIMSYEGEELAKLINAPVIKKREPETPASIEDNVTRNGRYVRKSYESDGIIFHGSYTLSDALKLAILPSEERQLLQRIAREIGDGMLGAFGCDIILENDRPKIAAIGIVPNAFGHRVAEEVLQPIERSDSPWCGTVRTREDAVGYRRHSSVFAMDRAQIEALVEALPEELRRRA